MHTHTHMHTCIDAHTPKHSHAHTHTHTHAHTADQGKALGSAEQAGTGDANSNALASSSGNHDLLELYCGNGNFTIPLAANFRYLLVHFFNGIKISSLPGECSQGSGKNASLIRLTRKARMQLCYTLPAEKANRVQTLKTVLCEEKTWDFKNVRVPCVKVTHHYIIHYRS